jgi:hypothetical protein
MYCPGTATLGGGFNRWTQHFNLNAKDEVLRNGIQNPDKIYGCTEE